MRQHKAIVVQDEADRLAIDAALFQQARQGAERDHRAEAADECASPDDRRAQVDQWLLELGAPQHLRSEEHTSELQSLMRISYAVFCLKKKKKAKDQEQLVEDREKKDDDTLRTTC